MSDSPARAVAALLRLPYWMMTGGLSVLTYFAIITTSGNLDLQIFLLIFFSMACITSAGFAFNDYFDKESDAIIKPRRPIPSGALSLGQVITISSFLFALGLVLAAFINWLSFAILLIDSVLLILYSSLVKKKSGFLANTLVGVLVGTAFLYGEATVTGTISLISISLYPIACGTIGGNIVRDVLSKEGDSLVGYPTLPQRIGNSNSVKIASAFFITTGVLAPLPYLLQEYTGFTIFYLPLILIWSILLIYASSRLITSTPTVENVRRYERIITMSMILLPMALILQALSPMFG